MIFKIPTLLLGLLVSVGLLSPLSAQTGPAPSQGTVKFRTVGWNDPVNLYYEVGGKKKPIYAKQGAPSQVQTYTGKNPIKFYGYEKPTTEQGPKTPAASITFDKDTGALLLVFIHNADETYTVLPLPDKPESVGPDQTRVYNAGAVLAAVELGGEQFQLKPGESKVVPSKGPTVCIKAAQAKDGKWKNLVLEYLDYEPGTRTNVIISSPGLVHFKVPVGYPPPPPLIILTIQTPAAPNPS